MADLMAWFLVARLSCETMQLMWSRFRKTIIARIFDGKINHASRRLLFKKVRLIPIA